MNLTQLLTKGAGQLIAAGAFALLSTACGHGDANAAGELPPDVLASVDRATLTRDEVAREMPGGLSAEDSARFVQAYVRRWVDSHIIEQIAGEEVDMAEIDRLTESYRRHLIMTDYRRKMFETHAAGISDDSIAAYYEAHKDEFRLERPMVRGTYLKVPEKAANLRTLRRLYRSDKPDDIDRLEKEVLNSAIHYDYFRDRWVDWEQIENRIPYQFGNVGSWLQKGRTLDATADSFTYLLYITEVLPAGAQMPLEGAREQILIRMLNASRRAYDAALLNDLYESATASGRVKIAKE